MIRSLGFQLGAVLACVTAAIGWLKLHDYKTVQKERARVEQKSNENAAKANAARRSVDSIPDERLRDKYCRDCR